MNTFFSLVLGLVSFLVVFYFLGAFIAADWSFISNTLMTWSAGDRIGLLLVTAPLWLVLTAFWAEVLPI